MTSSRKPPLTYLDAGVDIAAGDRLVDRIRPLAASTQRPGSLGKIGGFGGLFELPPGRFRAPVLVSGTDGVGTKLKLAFEMNRHHTIGIDLVAMCVNDVVVCGAEPLFFLDYFATGGLESAQAEAVIAGIAEGCLQAGAALIGGETAEMPGLYQTGEYDLAGFCVGAVEKDQIIDGSAISDGDLVIGIGSSGLHSNGYSLVHAVLKRSAADLADAFGDSTLGETLLTPTRIYVPALLNLIQSVPVHGIAHITGGGIAGNLKRVLPKHCSAELNRATWPQPAIIDWLQQAGDIDDDELLRTFNCGLGMVVVVAAEQASATLDVLNRHGEQGFIVGKICTGSRGVVIA
ncbi:MAG: phosphoribosylformylglycinamidine cyclo-ligase [Arenicellales bacterium]|nr:phosphoribosylformylglycinamidine cyclo-ligase [Arenicellales bacterium]